MGDKDSRPWGCWEVLVVSPRLVVKKMTVNAGERLSLQRHHFRSERWIMLEGKALVQRENEQMMLCPGDGVMIPCLSSHRLSNESDKPVTVLEIQFGDLLSEDDIERFEDDYGRHEEGR